MFGAKKVKPARPWLYMALASVEITLPIALINGASNVAPKLMTCGNDVAYGICVSLHGCTIFSGKFQQEKVLWNWMSNA